MVTLILGDSSAVKMQQISLSNNTMQRLMLKDKFRMKSSWLAADTMKSSRDSSKCIQPNVSLSYNNNKTKSSADSESLKKPWIQKINPRHWKSLRFHHKKKGKTWNFISKPWKWDLISFWLIFFCFSVLDLESSRPTQHLFPALVGTVKESVKTHHPRIFSHVGMPRYPTPPSHSW